MAAIVEPSMYSAAEEATVPEHRFRVVSSIVSAECYRALAWATYGGRPGFLIGERLFLSCWSRLPILLWTCRTEPIAPRGLGFQRHHGSEAGKDTPTTTSLQCRPYPPV